MNDECDEILDASALHRMMVRLERKVDQVIAATYARAPSAEYPEVNKCEWADSFSGGPSDQVRLLNGDAAEFIPLDFNVDHVLTATAADADVIDVLHFATSGHADQQIGEPPTNSQSDQCDFCGATGKLLHEACGVICMECLIDWMSQNDDGEVSSKTDTDKLGIIEEEEPHVLDSGKYQWEEASKGGDADSHLSAGEAITKYSWSDGKKIVSIYIVLDGLDEVSEDAITTVSGEKNVSITIASVAGKRRCFALTCLKYEITGAKVTRKKGKNTVVLKLQKKDERAWCDLLETSSCPDLPQWLRDERDEELAVGGAATTSDASDLEAQVPLRHRGVAPTPNASDLEAHVPLRNRDMSLEEEFRWQVFGEWPARLS
jgi:hypothetical protein